MLERLNSDTIFRVGNRESVTMPSRTVVGASDQQIGAILPAETAPQDGEVLGFLVTRGTRKLFCVSQEAK